MTIFRIGAGSDVHRLVEGRPLVIGGVIIETSDLGSDGHSDGDVLTHALTDAIFGALAAGDIGTHFPDTDERWRNADSFVFLRTAVDEMKQSGFYISNVDATVHLEAPKLRPYMERVRAGLSEALEIDPSCISIKAKTGEKVDAVGEKRAIRADVVVLIAKDR